MSTLRPPDDVRERKEDVRWAKEREALEWDLAQQHPSWPSRRCRRAADRIIERRRSSQQERA